MPEYEEALNRSVHVPGTEVSIDSLVMSDALVAANQQRRDGEGSLIKTDKLSPSDPSEYDGDTSNPDGEDTAAPRVLVTEPANDATEVPLSSQIKVTFTEEVDEPTIAAKNAQGAEIQGSTEFDSTGRTAIFTPAQPLKPGTTYTVEVSGAIDSSENMMDPYTWSFTTLRQAAGYWKFDEGNGRKAADSSGQGHDATLNDTAAWISGKSGHAVSNTPTQAQITASREAVHQGKTVEVADQTTATSVTYAQPDGRTFTTEI
ncbi:Ig-like domain-containing protein, partial [Planobispora rosea]|uniref:Ig-like domain-containing protein n=1 Tax=Planobispora rosea TaxID=35762 RepID=UPI00114D0569